MTDSKTISDEDLAKVTGGNGGGTVSNGHYVPHGATTGAEDQHTPTPTPAPSNSHGNSAAMNSGGAGGLHRRPD